MKAVCITLDEEGCVVFHLDADGNVEENLIGRIQVDDVVDTTGCGDSFAAGMAFGSLEHGDLVAACRYGNAMGAQRCSGSALRIYRSLTAITLVLLARADVAETVSVQGERVEITGGQTVTVDLKAKSVQPVSAHT